MKQSAATEDKDTAWGVVFAALGMGVMAALHVGKVPPALPAIRQELGLGLVGGGFVVSMFSFLGMLLGIAMGGLADRIGRRRTAVVGSLFLVLGGSTGALADGLPTILASRVCEGLGFMAVAVAMPGIVAEAASKRDRPLALGLWSVFTPTGFAIALLATPAILSLAGWRAVWGGLAALSLLTMLLLSPRLPALASPAPGGFGPRLAEVLGRPRIWLLSAAFGTYAFQWVTLMAWLPTYLVGVLGMSIGAASATTALIVAVNVPGNILAGALLRRRASPGLLIVTGSAVMGLTAPGLFLGVDFGVLAGIGLCLLFSFFGGLIPSVLFAQIPHASPSPTHAGQANGMLLQGSAAGQFVGPPLIGASVAAAGGAWTGAVTPLAVAALLTALLGAIAASQEAEQES